MSTALWTPKASAVFVIAVGLLMTGCGAGSPGSIRLMSVETELNRKEALSNLILETKANPDVTIQSVDSQRIVEKVLSRIKEKAPARFGQINPPTPKGDTLRAVINFTRYDEGNAFARFMLAGLGQIHIDADVTLKEDPGQSVLGKYEVTKTFAWGGLYGMGTKITDVEEGFAESVAAVILGEKAQNGSSAKVAKTGDSRSAQ
jgi:hypothetical protein